MFRVPISIHTTYRHWQKFTSVCSKSRRWYWFIRRADWRLVIGVWRWGL